MKPEGIGLAKTDLVDHELTLVRHFGLVLAWNDLHELVARLTALGTDFLISATMGFADQTVE